MGFQATESQLTSYHSSFVALHFNLTSEFHFKIKLSLNCGEDWEKDPVWCLACSEKSRPENRRTPQGRQNSQVWVLLYLPRSLQDKRLCVWGRFLDSCWWVFILKWNASSQSWKKLPGYRLSFPLYFSQFSFSEYSAYWCFQ